MSSPAKPKPAVRRRPHDRSEIRASFLPEGNRAAKWAYVCVLAGLCPGVGVVTGIAAIILGFFGRRIAKKDTEQRGLGHACMAMFFGAFEVFSQGVGWWILFE
jgi:hypothetical protein